MNSDQQAWGMHTTIDLYKCNPEKIRDAEYIKKFVIELCDLIDMKRFGDPIVVRFGDNPVVTGYSLVQLIETSDIVGIFNPPKTYSTGHFAENTNSVYLDIFSCRKYDSNQAVQFCVNFFEAQNYIQRYFERL